MRAYLIDPRGRDIRGIELTGGDRAMLEEMRQIIGADGLDHMMISDMHDALWVDDGGLKRGEPIYAFKLPVQNDPIAGKGIIIGADAIGRTQAPYIAIDILRRDVVWLGEIVPEVCWEETARGMRAIVTYARAK